MDVVLALVFAALLAWPKTLSGRIGEALGSAFLLSVAALVGGLFAFFAGSLMAIIIITGGFLIGLFNFEIHQPTRRDGPPPPR